MGAAAREVRGLVEGASRGRPPPSVIFPAVTLDLFLFFCVIFFDLSWASPPTQEQEEEVKLTARAPRKSPPGLH